MTKSVKEIGYAFLIVASMVASLFCINQLFAGPANASQMYSVQSIVYWTGAPCITVVSPLDPNGYKLGTGLICGGYSDAQYFGYSGEFVGADPVAANSTTTLGCKLYINGNLEYQDYAPAGDTHDVSCLRALQWEDNRKMAV